MARMDPRLADERGFCWDIPGYGFEMRTAIRSLFTTGVALTAVAVVAVSPVLPAPTGQIPTVQIPTGQIPTVQIPGIELTAAPALGAIPYQILINLLGDGVALAPILIGSTAQCVVCIGPVSPPSVESSPFTGWGAIGFAAGLLASPFAVVGAVQSGLSITQALGVGVLAFQIPANNTFALVAAPRQPFGGYEFDATRGRARQAVTDALVGTLGVAEQVLTGVRTTIVSGLVAITAFGQTLADTGDIITALQAGLAPISASIQTALGNTIGAVQVLREAIYTDLTGGPGVTTSPIPTVSAAAGAATAAARIARPRSAPDRRPLAVSAKSKGDAAKTRPARARSTAPAD